MLLVAVLILGLLGALLFSEFGKTDAKFARAADARKTLSKGRSALIGFSMGAIPTIVARPGDTIRPDVLSESPGNYDGTHDSGCLNSVSANGLPLVTSGATMRCLGRFPWRSFGLTLEMTSDQDTLGEMPWYAVSANLVNPLCVDTINSATVTRPFSSGVCNSASMPHPWLTVRDGSGNVLSSRVAVVLIVPGPPINGQQRRPYPNLGGANQYLDSVTIGGVTYSNADLDNDFVIGNHTATFNDMVTYITIDEWIALAEKRAANELIERVASDQNKESFRIKHNGNRLPWLAAFASPEAPQSYAPSANTFQGLLPIYSPGSSYPTSFTYQFVATAPVTYTISGSTLTPAMLNSYINVVRFVPLSAGQCAWIAGNSRRVSCEESITTGLPAGIAKRVLAITAEAKPTTAISSTPATRTSVTTRNIENATGSFTITDYSTAGTVLGTATSNAGINSASVTGMTLPLNITLPDWFAENKWHEFMYAAVAPDHAPAAGGSCTAACLTVGDKTNIKFVVITVGPALPALTQTRPSPLITNYLDSEENRDGNLIFTATSLERTNLNNDQIFIAP
jgi:hypothetical protein